MGTRSQSVASDDKPAAPLESLGLLLLWFGFEDGAWLGDLIPELDGAIGKGKRVLVSPPVRHGKTTAVMCAVVLHLLRNSKLKIVYMSHSATFSQRNSREMRRMFVDAGGAISKEHNTIQEWLTTEGGGLFAASCDQEVIGRGADLVVFDDPLEREDVYSPEQRDKVDETIRFLTTRLNLGGSVFVIMSRFHRDDPIGRRLRSKVIEWKSIHMAAILDEGLPTERALWPAGRPLEHLKAVRAELTENGDQTVWLSQFMGDPQAEEGGKFEGVVFGLIPPLCARIVIGLDAAYSIEKKSDFFVAVVMGEDPATGNFWILDVIRYQRGGVNAMTRTLSELKEMYPHARFVSYVSGPEIGVYDMLASMLGWAVEKMPARWNKSVRANACSAGWNALRILVPKGRTWTAAYVSEMQTFTGLNDAHDDQVDATVSAFDAMTAGRGMRQAGPMVGGPRYRV